MAGIGLTKTASAATIPYLATPLLRLLQLTLTRTYGTAAAAAAAQPQIDYDYYSQSASEQRRDQLLSVPMADSEGSVPRRGVQWAFIGSPLAKKHVYAEKLSKLLEVPHISMVNLVRQDLSPRSSLYKQIANAVNKGELVPEEEIVFGLLSKRLEDGHERGETGFILDGIPRSQVQAEILGQIANIDLVVNFKCTDDWLKEFKASSISSPYRESCGISNSAYTSLNISSRHTQPKSSTVTMEKAWKEKHQSYAKQMKPLEDYYRRQKKLLDFQVGNAPGETWPGLLVALHLQHLNAAYSTQKLTAESYLL